ncbi:MAG: dethiobiotin synthase [Desulfobacteraceae bacterium]|nr:dethiobiotin synthase [Desulfobacteraceae bacterium]
MKTSKPKFLLPPKLFITGTGTGVGKTVVSAMLMAGTKGVYWKPVQSGLEEMTDTQWIQCATGLSDEHFLPETYKLRQPLSPHASAALDGVHINLEAFTPPQPEPSTCLVVEGAGGVLVPLNERHFMLDLIIQLGVPVLLVASSQLGTINHTLLSLEKLRASHLQVIGVVMNGPKNESNRQAIEHFGQVPVLAQIEPLPRIDSTTLETLFTENFALTQK